MADKKETKKTSVKTKKSNLQYVPNLRKLYGEEIISSLKKTFNYSNIMEVPKLNSVSLNMGLGDAKNNSKGLESAIEELSLISGQKPVTTKAKKDISNFKIRKGWPVGCKVTLRSNRMYEFLERLIAIALPRTRDFRGLNPKSFDGQGNYSMGIKEQIIFPEINYDNIDKIRGMDICINTSASNKEDAKALLEVLNFPFKK